MWEMEGRTTQEIATALNTSPANVRHILVRARKSFVRVLEDWVVDETTGLTALNALSTTYKKAAELAQKSSKVALSLLLVITAFLGFNSMTGNEGSVLSVTPSITSVAPQKSAEIAGQSQSQSPSASAKAAAAAAAAKKSARSAINIKAPAISFFGLDKDGVPTGFTITDSTKAQGKARLTRGTSVLTPEGIVVSNQFITASGGPNILIDQKITIDGQGSRYGAVAISAGVAGSWTPLNMNSSTYSFERLANGNYLATATFQISELVNSDISILTGARGYDVVTAPASITTRLLLNGSKTQVLAQAVSVVNN